MTLSVSSRKLTLFNDQSVRSHLIGEDTDKNPKYCLSIAYFCDIFFEFLFNIITNSGLHIDTSFFVFFHPDIYVREKRKYVPRFCWHQIFCKCHIKRKNFFRYKWGHGKIFKKSKHETLPLVAILVCVHKLGQCRPNKTNTILLATP